MTHKDLDLWKNSVKFVSYVYEITSGFPNDEKYGLVSQIRRAAVSVPSNIAEGAGRYYQKEFVQFLNVASGSLAELDTQFIISYELKFISSEQLESISSKIIKIRSQLFGLIKSLKSKTLRASDEEQVMKSKL